MPRSRLTQHRPTRDARSEKKKTRDLEQENAKLKREIGTLRKQVNRFAQQAPDEQDASFETPKAKKPVCDSCESDNIQSMRIPTGEIVVCKSCGHKKVRK